MSAPHVESLSAEWIPSDPVGRAEEIERVGRLLQASEVPVPRAIVLGPPGSGSSLVARLAARRFCDRVAPGGVRPRILTVRVRCARGSVGVASDLLRAYDPGFSGQGFSTAEIVAGFLRRLIRDERGAVVVLDDIGPAGPDLSVVLRALLSPDHFLPEGAPRMPPFAVLLAVHSNAQATSELLEELGLLPDATVQLAPYSESQLLALLSERSQRALGRPADPEWLEGLAAQLRSEGATAPRALELLRERLVPPIARLRPSVGPGRNPASAVEPRLLSALQRACAHGPADVKSVRRWERTMAVSDRANPLPLTTLWRRLVRLEELGLLSRQVRTGGPGGTRSTIVLRSDLGLGSNASPTPSTRRARAADAGFASAMIWPAPAGAAPPWPPLAAVAAASGSTRRAPTS